MGVYCYGVVDTEWSTGQKRKICKQKHGIVKYHASLNLIHNFEGNQRRMAHELAHQLFGLTFEHLQADLAVEKHMNGGWNDYVSEG